MKFIWEEDDFKSDNNWGLMAQKGDEIVIIGGKSTTSLRDGFHVQYESHLAMAAAFNEYGYTPVLAPVNPSVVIKAAAKKQFNYGGGFQS
jgi:hypothetical protein